MSSSKISRSIFFRLGFGFILSASPSLADDAQNVTLVHRSACPISLTERFPLLFSVRADFVLYGDKEVIELLVPNPNGGFNAAGMFVCPDDRQMLALANCEPWIVVGMSDGFELLATAPGEIRSLAALRDDRRHFKIQTNGSLVISLSNNNPDIRTGSLNIFDTQNLNEIRLLSRFDGAYENICLNNRIDNLLAVKDDSLRIFDLADPENPRCTATIQQPRRRLPRLTWCNAVLAQVSLIDGNSAVEMFDLSNPDEPEILPSLRQDALCCAGQGDSLAFQTMEFGETYLYNIADPRNPRLLRSLAPQVNFPYLDIQYINFAPDGLMALVEGLPASIHHIVPDPNFADIYRLAQNYFPVFSPDKMFIRHNCLVINEGYKMLFTAIDEAAELNFKYPPEYAWWNVFNMIRDIEIGENWLAISEKGDSPGDYFLKLFRWSENPPLRLYYRRRTFPFNIGYEPNLLSVDNHLIVRERDNWKFYNLDLDGAPRLVGETDLPLSSEGVYRDGFLYCQTGRVFRVYQVGDLPELAIAAELPIQAERVFIHRNFVYIAGENGFVPVNIANPANPQPLDLYPIASGARQIAFIGNSAVVSTADGLITLDITDPFEIVELGHYYPQDMQNGELINSGFTGLAIIGNYIYTGTYEQGLWTLRFVRAQEAPAWNPPLEEIWALEGELIEFQIVATDPNDDHLELTMLPENLPDSACFTDQGNGVGTFVWQTDFNSAGDYQPVFIASDSELTDSLLIAMTVVNIDRLTKPLSLIPHTLSLHCFPNPFNSRATIYFDLPPSALSAVNLAIYDPLGRLVQNLTPKGWLVAGRHSLDADLNHITAGQYFLRLSDQMFSQTTKVTVIK